MKRSISELSGKNVRECVELGTRVKSLCAFADGTHPKAKVCTSTRICLKASFTVCWTMLLIRSIIERKRRKMFAKVQQAREMDKELFSLRRIGLSLMQAKFAVRELCKLLFSSSGLSK